MEDGTAKRRDSSIGVFPRSPRLGRGRRHRRESPTSYGTGFLPPERPARPLSSPEARCPSVQQPRSAVQERLGGGRANGCRSCGPVGFALGLSACLALDEELRRRLDPERGSFDQARPAAAYPNLPVTGLPHQSAGHSRRHRHSPPRRLSRSQAGRSAPAGSGLPPD